MVRFFQILSLVIGLLAANVPSSLLPSCQRGEGPTNSSRDSASCACCAVELACCCSGDSEEFTGEICLCNVKPAQDFVALSVVELKPPVFFHIREIIFAEPQKRLSFMMNEVSIIDKPPPGSLVKRYCVYLI